MQRKKPLRKHAYSNILKFLPSKNENLQMKNSDNFPISAQKHRLWVLVRTASARRFYRVPTIYVLSRNKKNNVFPCKPQFYYIKVGLRGSKLYRHVFVMGHTVPIHEKMCNEEYGNLRLQYALTLEIVLGSTKTCMPPRQTGSSLQ